MRRPVDLPVPDDDTGDLELEMPLQNQRSLHEGVRGREQSGLKRDEKFSTPESWMERTNQGSGTKSAGILPNEEEQEEWEAKDWPEERVFGRMRRSEGPQPGHVEEQGKETLQRALEQELFDKLKDENEKLQKELRFWKTQGRSEGNGMRARSRSPIPPPPPMMRSPPQRQVGKRQFAEEHEKFTPNGTRVPSIPPPLTVVEGMPQWPLENYDGYEVERVWKEMGWQPSVVLRHGLQGGGARSPRLHHELSGGGAGSPGLHHELSGGGNVKPRHGQVQGEGSMNEILTSVQARAVWLERELEAMKRTLANQPTRLSSEYWKDPVKRYEDVGLQQPAGLGEGSHRDRALALQQPAGLGESLHRDRALALQQPAGLGGVYHRDRALAAQQPEGLGGVRHQGRALHGTVLGVHQPLSKECPEDLGVEGDGDSLFGAPNHGVQEGHQQLHSRGLCDPKGKGEGGGKEASQLREKSPQDALRSTNPTIPMLPPVGQKHAAIQAADWLVEIKPIIGDISNRAHRWWELTMDVTVMKYQQWLQASPLQRLRIAPPEPVEWKSLGSEQVVQRLEQRVTTILLPAVPMELRNDLITSRHLWPAAIIYKILKSYQPGGWAERSTLLTDLTSTLPAKSPSAAATALRLWGRQKKRACELGASVPDALIQVRALEVIVSQAVLKFPQTMFRISTFRMEVGLDEQPTEETITQFVELLTAEMDAAALGTMTGEQSQNPSAKALQTPERKTTEGSGSACRFWGSDSGCKYGRACKFQHGELQDQAKRCFHCSGLDHRKSSCPHRENQQSTTTSSTGGSGGTGGSGKGGGKSGKGGDKGNGKGKTKESSSKQDERGEKSGNGDGDPKIAAVDAKTTTTTQESKPASEQQDRLDEKPRPSTGETELVQEVTSLLKSLRAGSASIKVCNLKRIQGDEKEVVLLDGGATNCLRMVETQEEWDKAEDIRVCLAEGETTMRQLPVEKTLLTRERVQAIIPVHMVTMLGYKVNWHQGGCKITHPAHGDLPVTLQQGCPTVPKDVGHRLLQEVEEWNRRQCQVKAMLAGEVNGQSHQGEKLSKLRQLFPEVPTRILQHVPGETNWQGALLPFNRRKRRLVERAKTLVIYAFSGSKYQDWVTLEKSGITVICLDLLLGHNLLDPNLSGWLESVIESKGVNVWMLSPPCRSTSLCRHRQDDGPKPLRGVNEERFGLRTLSESQQAETDQDSILWLKSLYWMWCSHQTGRPVKYILENPMDPNEWKTDNSVIYPSFWKWKETKKIQRELGLSKIQLEQGCLGHETAKPTTLLSNIEEVVSLHGLKTKEKVRSSTKWPMEVDQRIQFSKRLAEWAPGLKKVLIRAILRIHRGENPQLCRLQPHEIEELKEWEEHVMRGHCPYRRDCAVCVEARGRDKPRRRQVCPDSFTMSVDISGPYEPGFDQHVNKPRYYMTAVVTIPKVGDNPLVEGLRDLGVQLQETSHQEEDQSAPQIAMVKPANLNEQRGEQPQPQAGGGAPNSWCGGSSPAALPQPAGEEDVFPKEEKEDKVELSVAEVKEADALDRQWAECIQGRPRVEVENLSLSIPLRSRTVKDVIHATALLYTRFKSLNIPINRVHTDRAKEFLSRDFRQWVLARDIRQSTTAGDEAATNGRVESELGIVRGDARSLLKSSGLALGYWPMAIRAASEARFRSQLRRMGAPTTTPLPFGIKAYAHQKRWHRKSDWESPKQMVTLLGPAADMTMSSGGYYAELANGKFILTTAVIVPKVQATLQGDVDDLPPQEVQRPDQEEKAEDSFDLMLDEERGENLEINQDKPPDNPWNGVVAEVVIEPEQPATGFQRFPKTQGLTHRLHGKQTFSSTSPALRMLNYDAGGEDVDPAELMSKEFREDLRCEVGMMMNQHRGLEIVAKELVADFKEGIGEGTTDKVFDQVKRELGRLEATLKTIQEVENKLDVEEVLQTKTISMQEVKENYKEWIEPFEEEYQTLVRTVIQPLSREQAQKEIDGSTHVQRVPGKLVATVKPPFKKRGRIVACGNFADAATSETSASGLDTICIRALIRVAADKGWSLVSTDIRKAFLHAPRVEKPGHLTLVDPPKLLQTMGIIKKDEVWRICGALYGFQESPYHWGLHRDKTLTKLRWGSKQQFRLVELKEKNLWEIRDDTSQEQKLGFVGVYVDDIIVTSTESIAEGFVKKLNETWECSTPQWVGDQPGEKMRFCGYEIGKLQGGGFSLSQGSYIQDLLERHGTSGYEKVAAPKISMEQDEEYDQATLKRAQMVTGELQWIQSRTRPDLGYIVNAMSRWTHRCPKFVCDLGDHVLRFLNYSKDWEIWYQPSRSDDWGLDGCLQLPRNMSQLEVYIDTSYGLEHEQSRSVHGMLHEWAGAPLQWHSGRQPWVAASTGEAELIGYGEAHQQALSVGSVIELFTGEPKYVMYGDCKAALTLATAENGPWRTRHLRLRAHRLRECLRPPTSDPDAEPKWSARHMDGKSLVSDGLTKPLQGAMFQQFAIRLGLHGTGLKEKTGESKVGVKMIKEKIVNESKEMAQQLVKIGAALVSCAQPVVKACGALVITCGGQMMKEEKKQKPKLRAFRVPGGEQYPVRPTGGHQGSQAANRGAAVLGKGGGQEKGNDESSVPQWWDIEMLQRAPKGKDKWLVLKDRWLIRCHGEERRRSFQPVHRSCPLDVSQLKQDRHSLVFPCHDVDGRRLREDSWTSAATWTMDYRWVGYTIFEIKDEAKEEGQHYETRRRDHGQERHDPKEREAEQVSGHGQPSSSTASVGASVTYAPTINVSVNVEGYRVSTSRKSPRRSHAPSLGSFELVSEDEDQWP